MPVIFKDWFWQKLPIYFIQQDSNKDINGEGTLQRYLRNFGSELDENIKPYIDSFMNLFDALKCNIALLPQLSFILGLPPNLNNSEITYRKVIAYAVAIYRIKGTAKSYKAMFNLLGLNIQIIEEASVVQSIYDDLPTVEIYDAPISNHYDLGSYCRTYSIAYNNATNTPVDPAILALAQTVICFLQPIDARLTALVMRLEIDETYPLGITESTNLPTYVPPDGPFSDAFDNVNSFA